jgi:hypothetical protein
MKNDEETSATMSAMDATKSKGMILANATKPKEKAEAFHFPRRCHFS